MKIWKLSSEDASTNDDDDGEDDDLLVDEENEIVEHDVDVHMFGITKDLPFDNIGVTSLVLEDVLEGEDVNVVNGAKEAKDRFYMHFIESKRNLKLFKNDKTSAFQDQLQCELELQVSMRKAFRFKAKAEREVRGDHSLQYAMLRYYVVKLQSTNPDTTVKIIVKRKTDPSFPIRVFKRIYICLGSLKHRFRAFIIELLGLDGAS
ncbi:hypothetical protein Tco_1498081 [Tanacetum coccineum]